MEESFYGPVILCKDSAASAPDRPEIPSIERYAEVTGVMGDAYVVAWRGRSHLFCRDTGKCIESQHGEMRGYAIAGMDMERFARTLALIKGAPIPAQTLLS